MQLFTCTDGDRLDKLFSPRRCSHNERHVGFLQQLVNGALQHSIDYVIAQKCHNDIFIDSVNYGRFRLCVCVKIGLRTHLI